MTRRLLAILCLVLFFASPAHAFVVRRIIVLSTNRTFESPQILVSMWADVPAELQSEYANSSFISAVPNVTATELQELRDGKVLERTAQLPLALDFNVADIQNTLISMWTAYQDRVSTVFGTLKQLCFWDGIQWVSCVDQPSTEIILDDVDGTIQSGSWTTETRSNALFGTSRTDTGAGGVALVGVSPQVASSSLTTLTPVLPTGVATNDQLMAIVTSVKLTPAPTWTFPAGWTQVASRHRSGTGSTTKDLTIEVWRRTAGASEVNPAIQISSAAEGWTSQVAVYRGVNPTTPMDATAVAGDNAAAATWVPPSITTVTNNAWVGSAVMTDDDNEIGLSTAQGFITRMSGADYDTVTGGDQAVALADKRIGTAGAVTMPTWNQVVRGTDEWAGITFALRPASQPGSPADTFRWTPTITVQQSYDVFTWWSTDVARDNDVRYTIVHAGGTSTVDKDQTINGGQWNSLGTFTFNIGTTGYVEVSDLNGNNVSADAIKWAPAAGAITWTMTVGKTGAGAGTVTSSPAGISCGADCTEVYSDGTSVTLTAAAAVGSSFIGWEGDCTGSSTCVLTMTRDMNVVARFDTTPPINQTLTITKAGDGTGTVTSSPAGISCGADCTEAYAADTSVTLTATPDADMAFSGWSGDCSGTATTCIVVMSSTRNVTATFATVPPSGAFYASLTGSDSNAGTQASPFRTITKCVSVLEPGDTCYMRGGTYTEAITNGKIPAGTSWTSPVTLAVFAGETVTIRPSSGSHVIHFASPQRFIVVNGPGLILDGINVTSAVVRIGANNSSGGANHIRLQDVEVRNAKNPNRSLGAGIGVDITAVSNDNELIRVNSHNNGANEHDHGIYVRGSRNLVDGGESWSNTGAGLQVRTYSSTTIATGNVIRNVMLHDNGTYTTDPLSYGIQLVGPSGTVIYNNLIWGQAGGIRVDWGANGTKLYNNTIVENTPRACIDVAFGGTATNTTIKNNICYQNGAGIRLGSGASGTVQSNNLVEVNPLFFSQSGRDFHLTSGSPARNQGTALTEFSADFDGVTRPKGTAWDIGAFEFVE